MCHAPARVDLSMLTRVGPLILAQLPTRPPDHSPTPDGPFPCVRFTLGDPRSPLGGSLGMTQEERDLDRGTRCQPLSSSSPSRASRAAFKPCQAMNGTMASAPTGSAHHHPKTR